MTESVKTLSLAMIVKNEARCLARCLVSVRGLASECIIVDTGSTDATVQIARDHGASVHSFAWINDFSAARNDSLARTSGDWILVLDADEYASPELAAEIKQFIQGPPSVGRLRIVSEFRRNGQSMTSQGFVSRLFPRGARFEGRIHEQLASPLPRLNLTGALWHDGYLETHKSDRNIQLLQRELEQDPGNAHFLFQLALEYSSLNQPARAFDCLQKAFARMQPGDAFAPNIVVDYLHAILELRQFDTGLKVIEQTRAALDDFPDFHFVCGLFYMNLVRSNPSKHIALLPKIELSYKRCLTLGETDRYKSVRGAGSFLAWFNLGTLYHVFGEQTAARTCFEKAAELGYAPAIQFLKQLTTKPE